jgi:hypothetical protein
MQNLILGINGSLILTFFELNGKTQVTPAKAENIISKLKSGEYAIGLASGEVVTSLDLVKVATFKFEVGDDTEYDYNLEEEF